MSMIDTVIAYRSYASVFTWQSDLCQNPAKHYSVEKVLWEKVYLLWNIMSRMMKKLS